MLTLTQSLRRLEKHVTGPRDWYRIDHYKVMDGSFFHVEAHLWRGERRQLHQANDASLARAVNIVLFNIASPGTI